MKSVARRLNLFFLAFSLLLIIGAYSIHVNRLEISDLESKIELHEKVVTKAELLSIKSFDESLLKSSQELREKLEPIERQTSFSLLLQAYSTKNQREFNGRMSEFLANESKFKNYIVPQIKFLREKQYYLGRGLFVLTILFLLYLRYFLSNHLFSQLRDLKKQMDQFQEGKYSYEFQTPPDNEIGQLHSTFNSMAQKILGTVDDLKSLDIAKTEFLNIASHELRTPMTSIKGSLGLLSSGAVTKLPEEAVELITIAELETDRLIRLINDILDMAKIEAKKVPLKEVWNSTDTLLKRTVQGIAGFAGSAKIKVTVEKECDGEFYGDSDRVQQVLTNLLSNAIKFSPENSEVRLRISETDKGHVMFEVKDQGKGISPEDQAQLFQKFKQVTGTDNPLVKGTGLGLAIAKALIEEHNGKIGIRSELGKGCTFFFTLPKWRSSIDESRIAA
jgi:signal transduction histidine kinase